VAASLWRYLWASPNTALGLLFAASAIPVADGLRAVDGVLEAHSPLIAFLLRRCTLLRGGAAAITLGHVVLGHDLDALRVSREHEHVHVRQYERWGPFFIPAYLAASVWAFVNGRGAYAGNRFEREAWRHEAA
jgi:hypothetical protein